ncbi:hypothetical protein ACFQY5_22930 [Paeniroseomonas aquatica]|uniref:hypothetical protein n=1 Tax=Paeniroseomonas aquatica TaxID=373043 RepID=UPI0036238A0F
MLDSTEYRIPSMRHKVSPAEWQARVDLAACYRLVAHYEMNDLIANHVSVRVPGEDPSSSMPTACSTRRSPPPRSSRSTTTATSC